MQQGTECAWQSGRDRHAQDRATPSPKFIRSNSMHQPPRIFSCILIFCLLDWTRGANPAGGMLGFTEEHSVTQAKLEKRFDAEISAADQKAWLEQMASA